MTGTVGCPQMSLWQKQDPDLSHGRVLRTPHVGPVALPAFRSSLQRNYTPTARVPPWGALLGASSSVKARSKETEFGSFTDADNL